MNKSELSKHADRLREINDVIKQLEPEIRAPAFELLRPYVMTSPTQEPVVRGNAANVGDQHVGDREQFFSRFDTDKPADNALLLAADYYRQYGANPFSAEELKRSAREVGLIVPERIDMTLRNARREGRALFQSIGRGSFRPTVHGEVFFKTSYNVTPGRRLPAQVETKSAEQ